MKVKFISVGQNFVNFIAETDNVTYRWLWKQVKPYFASTTVDCRFISDFEGKIYAGFQEAGRFEVIDNEYETSEIKQFINSDEFKEML